MYWTENDLKPQEGYRQVLDGKNALYQEGSGATGMVTDCKAS